MTLDKSERWFEPRRFADATTAPDEPDNRKNHQEPASLSQEGVRIAEPDTDRTTPDLAFCDDILGEFQADIERSGVAGEEKLTALAYLCLTSRILPWGKPAERPASLIAKGTTSSGKSHVVRSVLRFFPADAYLDIGSMSRRFLFYTEESFEHRFIYVPEYASIKDDEELVALLRVLLSEGRVVHGTVDINRAAQMITKEGPTGLLMTTTEAAVDDEMETRCLTVITDDSTDQTRQIFLKLAELEDGAIDDVDYARWHRLQRWLVEENARATVPFALALARLMPTSATRLRRDFPALLSLVRTHALLYQAQRDRDERDLVVATTDDYEVVLGLVGDLIAEGVEEGVSTTVRETVEAVRELTEETSATTVTPKQLTERMKVGRSAAYDRIRRTLRAGYLINEALREERGMKLTLGAPLPSAADFLPSVGAINEVMSGRSPDRPSGHVIGSTEPEEDDLSGSPGRPDEMPVVEPTTANGRLVGLPVRCSKHGAITTITKVSHGIVFLGCCCNISAQEAENGGADFVEFEPS